METRFNNPGNHTLDLATHGVLLLLPRAQRSCQGVGLGCIRFLSFRDFTAGCLLSATRTVDQPLITPVENPKLEIMHEIHTSTLPTMAPILVIKDHQYGWDDCLVLVLRRHPSGKFFIPLQPSNMKASTLLCSRLLPLHKTELHGSYCLGITGYSLLRGYSSF